MASGIIYTVIAGMWIAYFLPRWVHNRNEFSGKSVEKYKSALRVVAESTPGANIGSGVIYTDLDRERKVAQTLLRRRLIFAILFASFIMTTVGVIMDTVALSLLILPVAGFAFYLGYVRYQSSHERAQRRRIENIHRETTKISSTNLAGVVTAHSTNDHWIPFAEREITGVTIIPRGAAAFTAAWDPNKIPVPTYVNAPKAITPKRIIDLTTPGAWSEEQEKLEREALDAIAPSRDDVFDQQLADEAVAKAKENRASNQ